MEQTRPYQRSLYRLPVTYPTMYCVTATVGEATITNLSAMGCTIEADQPLLANQRIALRLMLPDQHESLPIDEAYVRWVHGNLGGSSSSKWNVPQISGCMRSYGMEWSDASTRFNKSAQRLRPFHPI